MREAAGRPGGRVDLAFVLGSKASHRTTELASEVEVARTGEGLPERFAHALHRLADRAHRRAQTLFQAREADVEPVDVDAGNGTFVVTTGRLLEARESSASEAAPTHGPEGAPTADDL